MRHLPAILYPKACEHPSRYNNKVYIPSGPFLKAAGRNFLLLQLLFLGLFAYVFGSLFQQESRTHSLNIVLVDYDAGGAIGDAVRTAYRTLASNSYPTLVERSAAEFPAPDDIEVAVCGIQFWAALYISAGASQRLQTALSPDPGTTPPPYDGSNVLTYIWNEARYPSVVDQAISSNLQVLSDAARDAYMTALTTNGTTSTNLALAARPWTLASNNIKPTTQGSRAIYNTLVFILVIIQEFFYLGTINGLYARFRCYTVAPPHHILLVRLVNSALYCLSGSLCIAGTIFAFRSGWELEGRQFVGTWMVVWLFAHINFQLLDVFTVWMPLPYVPMSLITWLIINATSILLPLELSPGFYKIGLALPAHNVYQTLLDVWSAGCNPRLHVTLPILFAWEIVGFLLSGLGVYRRSHYAILEVEKAKDQFQERVDTAVDQELSSRGRKTAGKSENTRDKEKGRTGAADELWDDRIRSTVERKETVDGQGTTTSGSSSNASTARLELEEAVGDTDRRLERERRASRSYTFGPAFDLPFDKDTEN